MRILHKYKSNNRYDVSNSFRNGYDVYTRLRQKLRVSEKRTSHRLVSLKRLIYFMESSQLFVMYTVQEMRFVSVLYVRLCIRFTFPIVLELDFVIFEVNNFFYIPKMSVNNKSGKKKRSVIDLEMKYKLIKQHESGRKVEDITHDLK